MKTFEDHMLGKRIEYLAEKCAKQQIPIVEYVQWYEEEGQFLEYEDRPLDYQPSLMGNMGKWGLAGAGLGSVAGPMGSVAGAGLGALGGVGKYMWDKGKQYLQRNQDFDTAKNQAVQALTRLTKLNPALAPKLAAIINGLGKMADAKGSAPGAGGAPAAPGAAVAPSNSSIQVRRSYLKNRPLANILHSGGLMTKSGEPDDELYKILVNNAIGADKFNSAFDPATKKYDPSKIEAILSSLGVMDQNDKYFKWNSSSNHFEAV